MGAVLDSSRWTSLSLAPHQTTTAVTWSGSLNGKRVWDSLALPAVYQPMALWPTNLSMALSPTPLLPAQCAAVYTVLTWGPFRRSESEHQHYIMTEFARKFFTNAISRWNLLESRGVSIILHERHSTLISFFLFFRQNKDERLNEMVEYTSVRMHLFVSHSMHAGILYGCLIVFVCCVFVC